MKFQSLTPTQKAALLYLAFFQLDNSEHNEKIIEQKSDTLDYELTKISFPTLDNILFDNDGEPMIDWESFDPTSTDFNYGDFIEPYLIEGTNITHHISNFPITF